MARDMIKPCVNIYLVYEIFPVQSMYFGEINQYDDNKLTVWEEISCSKDDDDCYSTFFERETNF